MVAGASKISNDPCTPHKTEGREVLSKSGSELGSESEFTGSLYTSSLAWFCVMSAVGNVVVFNGMKLPLLMTTTT